MNKHTPGPWTVEKGHDKTHPYSVTGDGFDLARCVTADDAALIATAPDLLAALREVVNTFTPDAWPEPQRSMLRNARAAVAKAEGGAA